MTIFQMPESESALSYLAKHLGQGLGSGFQQGLSDKLKEHQDQKKMQLEREQNKSQLQGLAPMFEQLGMPKEGIQQFIESGIKPELAVNLLNHLGVQQQKEEARIATVEEGRDAKRAALSTLDRQRALLKRGRLGPKLGMLGGATAGELPKLGISLTAQGKRDRAEYERLGKSLIQLSATIPIRNRQEFEVLAESLYDPTLSESTIEGNLDAMERIIKNSLPEEEQREEASLKKVESGTELTSEIAERILSQVKGDKSEARKLAKKLGYSWD